MLTYDLRHALKALVRRPGLSCSVLLILALGIGSTTTIFSIASSVLLSEIPYKDGDRLVVLRMLGEQAGSAFPASYLDVGSWREQSRTLELISASSDGLQLNLTEGGRAERVEASFVSASYFDLLGVRPALGRSFAPAEEDRTSPQAVTVLGHGLWKRRFGGDPAIVGRSIQIQGMAFQIIGVLPEGFRDIYPDVDLYVPVTMARLIIRKGYIEDRISRWLDVYARRRPGVGVEQARQEMLAITRRLAATFPATNEGYSVKVEPLRTSQLDFSRMRLSILTLLIGAVFVLLVGCANVTNLLLVRAVERRKEVALRLALGITRNRLIRYFVLEGALLCLAGALLGVGAAVFAVRLLAKLGNSAYDLPGFIHFSVDLRALAAAVVLSVLISFLIGVVPARKSLTVSLQEELQSEGKGHSHSAGTAFTRSFLAVSAIFFSVVLLIGAGLMAKSLQALIQNDPGFRVDNILSARFELPANQYQTDEPVYQLYKQVIEKARALPGVEDAGLWAPAVPGSSHFYLLIVPEGRSLEKAEDKFKVYNHRVSPDLLRQMRITLLKGRFFTEQDDARHPLVAIVSRSAAEALWPSRDPIGKRFWVTAPQEGWAEVVGVVADADQRGPVQPDHDFRRDIYLPLFQMRARTASILLRTREGGGPTAEQLGLLLRTIAPDIPVYDVKTLQERKRDEEAGTRLNASLLIFFAASALVLAIIGIYSVLLYTVRQQSFEIGIRMAVGADQSQILRHFVWKGAALLGIGLIAGLVFALGMAKTMASLLFNVNPRDPLVFILVPCVVALISLPAILQPAYWATRVEPSSLFRRS
ncbi:MAG TPA: ABC transporter permease [Thermoanaerobaculia bacterium]|nr:ABC transporter permease [Thermoanaerobaculia bacterium]